VCSSFCPLDTNAVALLSNAPAIQGEWYRCGDMVRVVNCLRRLGKEQALAVLKYHLHQNGPGGPPSQEFKLHLVCRLLFVNPQGWKPPRLGHPLPGIEWKTAEQFPYFPLALSKGVPFLLLRGYASGAFTSDTGENCVKMCEGFALITADLPENGFPEAAQALVHTEAFQKLYSTDGLKEATRMVLAQAESTRPESSNVGVSRITVTPAPETEK